MSTLLTVMSIVLTLESQTVYDGQTIAGAAFIGSVEDPSGRKIIEYAFCDDGAAGGYFTYDGVRQPAGKWLSVSASRLSQIAYVAGAGGGDETISAEAYDGAQWSVPYSTTATILLPPPMVTASASAVRPGRAAFGGKPTATRGDPGGEAIGADAGEGATTLAKPWRAAGALSATASAAIA
jgi:hypothetical protein